MSFTFVFAYRRIRSVYNGCNWDLVGRMVDIQYVRVLGNYIQCSSVVNGLMVERYQYHRVSVVIDVEQEVPIWLIVGEVFNIHHVVEDNRCVQEIGVCMLCSLY